MPDDETERPSLEPPKLFGRKKGKPAAPPPPEPAPAPADEPSPATDEVADEPTEEHTEELAPAEPTTEAAPVFVDAGIDEHEAETPSSATATGTTQTLPAQEARPVKPAKEPATPKPPRERRPEGTPLLPGRPAALVTGLLVGAVLVGAVWLGFRGCEAVRGTSSCGAGPGMAALLVIFVLAVVAGRYLLAAFQIPDPAATSFLAVGLTGVISLLFLVDVLDTWPMTLVIPAITAATFLLSWWVTTTFVESETDRI